MSMKKTIFSACIVFSICALPLMAMAAGGLVPCDGANCDFAKLIQLGNNVIKFCIVVGSSVFAIMFMYAGYLYLTAMGNSSQISQAHGLFTNAVIGFIIMLAAWLIIDFIFDALVKGEQYRLLKK